MWNQENTKLSPSFTNSIMKTLSQIASASDRCLTNMSRNFEYFQSILMTFLTNSNAPLHNFSDNLLSFVSGFFTQIGVKIIFYLRVTHFRQISCSERFQIIIVWKIICCSVVECHNGFGKIVRDNIWRIYLSGLKTLCQIIIKAIACYFFWQELQRRTVSWNTIRDSDCRTVNTVFKLKMNICRVKKLSSNPFLLVTSELIR